MNAFIVSLEQAVLNLAQGETDAEISAGQCDRGCPRLALQDSEQWSFPYNPPSFQIALHFLSSSVYSLSISISVSPSPLPLSCSLPVCLFFLLIKQGQTGFISLIQTEGVNISLMLDKRPRRQESRCQVSDYIGRTPLLWGPGSTDSELLQTMEVSLGNQEPFLLPNRGHCH